MNKPDVIVVPNGPNPVNYPTSISELGPVTEARINRGVWAANDERPSRLLFTGRAAPVMSRYAGDLRWHGIDSLIERQSFDTISNAHYAKVDFLQPHGWYNVHVITSPWNLHRTRWVWKQVLGGGYQLTFEPVESESDDEHSRLAELAAEVYDEALLLGFLGIGRARAKHDARREKRLMRWHPRSPEFVLGRLAHRAHAA